MNYFDNCSLELLPNSIEAINMSDEEYFTSPIYKDYVSNSKLKYINPAEGGSPELFSNPPDLGYNQSLEFGSAVHELILQPEAFGLIDYTDKPSAKLGLFIDKVFFYRNEYHLNIQKSIEFASVDADYYNGKLTPKILRNAIKKGLVYYLDMLNDNIIPEMPEGMQPIVLSESTFKAVSECLEVYENNSPIKTMLTSQNILKNKQSFNELAMFANFKVTLANGESTVIPFKLKIDNFTIDDVNSLITLNDLKTTSHPIDTFMGGKQINEHTGKLEGFLGSWQKMHYYRQIAAYMMVLQNLYKEKKPMYQYNANILAIESKPPYDNKVFKISNAYVQKGLQEFKELMCRVAFYKIYGKDARIES